MQIDSRTSFPEKFVHIILTLVAIEAYKPIGGSSQIRQPSLKSIFHPSIHPVDDTIERKPKIICIDSLSSY